MKSKTTALILCLFLGGIGVHKFYLGRTVAGILYLVFFWTLIPSFIAVIDLIMIAIMNDADFNAKYNTAAPAAAHATSAASTDNLTKLAELYKQNIITKEEFEAKKASLLAKIG